MKMQITLAWSDGKIIEIWEDITLEDLRGPAGNDIRREILEAAEFEVKKEFAKELGG